VLPVIVTSKPRDEISADLEQAQRLGVLVLSKENLTEALSRTILQPDAERLYAEVEEAVRTAQGKYVV
jgi:Na+-transporting NADH:ubiquinone oxidoreductase subunit NqrA